jgi:hypothetical protein
VVPSIEEQSWVAAASNYMHAIWLNAVEGQADDPQLSCGKNSPGSSVDTAFLVAVLRSCRALFCVK